MKKLALHCVKYGEIALPESMVFSGGCEEISVPITLCIYCIRTETQNILVDAGCDTMPGYPLSGFVSPARAIREIGLSADEITDVVITHAHHDHIDGVGHFRNATVHISRVAYEKGKKYIPPTLPVALFEKEMFLTPEIRVREWGGHAKGSSVVEVTDGPYIHVFAGDECYNLANMEQKRPTGSCVDAARAKEFVEHYSGEHYLVHTCHDASLKSEEV